MEVTIQALFVIMQDLPPKPFAADNYWFAVMDVESLKSNSKKSGYQDFFPAKQERGEIAPFFGCTKLFLFQWNSKR